MNKDTEDERDERSSRQSHAHMGHPEIQRCLGDTIREHALQTHE